MKKTILKVLASMLVLAMAITAIVIPSTTAKAADKETEIVLILSKETDGVVLLDFDNGGNTAKLEPQGTTDKTSLSSWGRTMYRFTQDANNPLVYRMTVKGSVASGYANIQFVIAKNGNGQGFKYYPQDDRNTYNNNDALYFNLDLSNTSWPVVKPSTTNPFAATAADVMAEIDKIGTVTLSDDVKAKIEAARGMVDAYSGDASDITNLSKLTEAEAEWARLVAAAAGELTLHVKTSWTSPKLYGWDGANKLATWPGTAIPADELNDGWYTITTTLSAPGSLIINNGSSQTADWKYVSAGEVWVTMDGTNFTPSRTAPAGWVTEAGGDPAPVPETTYHVVGLGGDDDWSNTDANKMTLTDGNYVYKKTLVAGDYQYKVHSSTDEWIPSTDNLTFTVETECEVTFTYNPTTGDVTAEGTGLAEPVEIEDGYYVLGSMNGWTTLPEYKMSEVGDGYTLTIELKAGEYEFKVKQEADTDVWYPADENMTFEVKTDCEVTFSIDVDGVVKVYGDGIASEEITPAGDFNMVLPLVLVLFGGAVVIVASKKRFA